MDYRTAFQSIGIDAATLYKVWNAYQKIFSDYIEAVVEALESAVANTFNIAFCVDDYPTPIIDPREAKRLLKRAEDICRNQAGLRQKK